MATKLPWTLLVLVLGSSSGLALSCGPEIEEVDEELERSCHALCEQHERCDTEYARSVDAVADCVDECMDVGFPPECREQQIAYAECSAALPCEDFLLFSGPGPFDPETGPCAEERVALGQCVAQNR